MAHKLDEKWIEIRLPGAFGKATKHLRDALGWQFRQEANRSMVCLQERYENRTPQVVRLSGVIHAQDASDPRGYVPFEAWQTQDHYLTAAREVYPYLSSLQATGKPAGQWAAFMLSVLTAPDPQFIPQVKAMFEGISRDFIDSRLHIATLEPTFTQRLAAVRGLFAAEHTPEVLERKPFQGFPAARGLIADMQSGLRSYISPILLGRMPFVLGVTTSRSNGLIILNFGHPLEGVEDMGYSGLYQLFVPSNFFSRARLDIGDHDWPDLSAEEVDEAIRWWVAKLNGLLGTVLDPSVFAGSDGVYSPSLHLSTHLSLDRLASTITAILAYELTDQFVRKVMFFDAMDLFEGMGWGDYKKTLSHRRAQAVLQRLEQEVPTPIDKILLGRCRRAVNSLKEVQDGFFVTERIRDGEIELTDNKGRPHPHGLGTAAAEYLRLVRNSSHSFLKDAQKPFPLSLLASHTGDIPSSISDLPLLYFLELLIHPEEKLRDPSGVYRISA